MPGGVREVYVTPTPTNQGGVRVSGGSTGVNNQKRGSVCICYYDRYRHP